MEGNIDRIHDDSLYWPGTDTSIKSGVVELVLRAKAKRELKEINKLGENRNNQTTQWPKETGQTTIYKACTHTKLKIE
jgi:hypothetical protein